MKLKLVCLLLHIIPLFILSMNQMPLERKDENCTICFEQLYDGKNDAITLSCHKMHSFHLKCLYGWKQKGNTCPFCRAPFTQPAEPDEVQFSSLELKQKKSSCNMIMLKTILGCIGLGCHLRP